MTSSFSSRRVVLPVEVYYHRIQEKKGGERDLGQRRKDEKPVLILLIDTPLYRLEVMFQV